MTQRYLSSFLNDSAAEFQHWSESLEISRNSRGRFRFFIINLKRSLVHFEAVFKAIFHFELTKISNIGHKRVPKMQFWFVTSEFRIRALNDALFIGSIIDGLITSTFNSEVLSRIVIACTWIESAAIIEMIIIENFILHSFSLSASTFIGFKKPYNFASIYLFITSSPHNIGKWQSYQVMTWLLQNFNPGGM